MIKILHKPYLLYYKYYRKKISVCCPDRFIKEKCTADVIVIHICFFKLVSTISQI